MTYGLTTDDGSVLRERYDAATAHLDPPLAIVDLDAFYANSRSLVERAMGKPIRVASKSIRVRSLLGDVLTLDGFSGVLAYTLPEALWLAELRVSEDIVVAYPTADRAAIVRLAANEATAAAVTIMVDDVAQLDLVDSVSPADNRPEIRVCLELDVSWQPLGGRIRLGALRSPMRTAGQLQTLAEHVVRRPGFRLVGLMAYESQIAGVPDAPPGNPARGRAVREMQRRSRPDVALRRTAAVEAVRAIADLEFVNGGGTGSVETTAGEPSVTEVAAGSGLLGPRLFDGYSTFQPAPAALFALPVVRRPRVGVATVLGGGYVASGPAGKDRLPAPWLPAGLRSTRSKVQARCRHPYVARPRTHCASAIGCGSGTPRPANWPSTSPRTT